MLRSASAEQHRLGEADEVGRRHELHDLLQGYRHTFERRLTARQQTHDDEHGKRQQSELRHRSNHRGEHDSKCGDRKEVHHEPAKRRAGVEPAIGTPIAPLTTKNSEAIAATTTTSPFAQILANMSSYGCNGITNRCSMRSMLTFPQHRRAGQEDREHGNVVDDLVDRDEPALLHIRIESGAGVEFDQDLDSRGFPRSAPKRLRLLLDDFA